MGMGALIIDESLDDCGGVKVGYLLEVSCLKDSISKGDALMVVFATVADKQMHGKSRNKYLPISGSISFSDGKSASSLESFLTRASSRTPPQQTSILFHNNNSNCEDSLEGGLESVRTSIPS
jgi:hypothetical protein